MTVKNICPTETAKLNQGVYWFSYHASHSHYQFHLMLEGWQFYVVDQTSDSLETLTGNKHAYLEIHKKRPVFLESMQYRRS